MELSAFSKARPLILLTEFPADARGGGAVIIRSLLRGVDPESIVWLTLAGATSLDTSLWPNQIGLKNGSAGHNPQRPSIFKDSLLYAKPLADEVLRIAAEKNAGAIWVVLHGAAVHVAAQLVRRGKLPIHATVHDDPPFATTMRSRRTCMLLPLVERDFSRALRGATSIDVICQAMADRYQQRYGVKSCVIHRGMDESMIQPSPEFNAQSGLSIALLGNTYNYTQLPILANAIATAAGQLGTTGRLLILGQGFGARLQQEWGNKITIEAKGHLNEQQAVHELQSCFMLYLNYPLSRSCRVLRQTSFPTKLSTYIMASRPILMHAPPDSSTANLSTMSPYINTWSTNRLEDGIQLLTAGWNNPALRHGFHNEAQILRQRFYDYQTNRTTLLTVLNALGREPMPLVSSNAGG